MTSNLCRTDRVARLAAAAALALAAVLLDLPWVALAALGVGALYLAGTSLVGTCLGYKLMGMSSCPLPRTHV